MNKPLIDALKREPYTKKELLEILKESFPSKSKDAMRKMVERGLIQLITLGLVEKLEDKYCWYIYVNFLDENYAVKLNHSQKLIPALRRIAGDSRYYDDETETTIAYAMINEECAEAHLIAYPEILGLYQQYQNLRHKMKEEKEQLLTKLNGRVKKVFGEIVTAVTPRLYYESHESFVGKNISSIIYRIIASKRSMPIRVHKEELVIGENLVARGSHLFEKIKELVMHETEDKSNISTVTRIEKREKESSILQKKLRKKILELIMKIKSGEPLKVKCRTCPEVYDLPDK